MTKEELKSIRAFLGLTQRQLGEKLRLSGPHPDRTIRKWEAGNAKISGPATIALDYMMKDATKSKAASRN